VSRSSFVFTSESVSEGHPDKVCDRISDEVVDLFFREGGKEGIDPWTIRAACETLATTNKVVIAGEYRGPKGVTVADIQELARKAIREIGYEQDGFHWANCNIDVLLHEQSPDIAQGVDRSSGEMGAGDQGMMFGYATTETPELMPLPIALSHRMVRKQAEARHSKELAWLRPDAKGQVTVEYTEPGKPARITTIVLSTQHDESVLDKSGNDMKSEARDAIIEHVVKPVMPTELDHAGDTVGLINPTGKFVMGGPHGDCGLTGRKIIVDTYGGMRRCTAAARSAARTAHEGRPVSAAYAWAATSQRTSLPLGWRIAAEVQLVLRDRRGGAAFDLRRHLHAPATIDEAKLEDALGRVMSLSPTGIRRKLDLNKPIFARTSAYGHFGRQPDADGGFSWEKTDLVDDLKSALA
jgi:S-adenosylmethionine synthetase